MGELITQSHASEAGHWYDREGKPAYEVISKSGYPRPATLADARKLDLVPSVTTIIRCAAQPGLERWKQEQVLYSALTLPRKVYAKDTPPPYEEWQEPEDEWIARVFRDSGEQARKAADRGTEIHAAIERWYGTEGVRASDPGVGAVTAVANAVADAFGDEIEWFPEATFAGRGYGGKADLISRPGHPPIVIDFKGKDPADIESGKTLAYDEHCMQLAAYRAGLFPYEARCANVFFSRQEPWLAKVYEWAETDLQRGWEMFQALLDYWYAKTGLVAA